MSDMRIMATPSAAASAYARVQGSGLGGASEEIAGLGGVGADANGTSFGATLSNALQGVVSSGEAADSAAASGITGHGNLTQVVMAVSRAQLALQTTTAIRDRVMSAYQDIMKMSI